LYALLTRKHSWIIENYLCRCNK